MRQMLIVAYTQAKIKCNLELAKLWFIAEIQKNLLLYHQPGAASFLRL